MTKKTWKYLCWFVALLAGPSAYHAAAQTANAPGGIHATSFRILAAGVGHASETGEPVKCGLPVLTAGLRERSILSAAAQSALSNLQTRLELQATVVTGGFRFHFDTSTVEAPALLNAQHQRIPGTARAFVDSAAAMMAYVAQYETSVLGFDPPPTDGGLGGGPEYDIYIRELGSLYGETMPDASVPDGSTASSFITIDNDFIFVNPDSNKGLPGLRVTLAHEYYHAIQIGRYGFWTNDIWFYEISSVWMEDVVYTGVNDYYQYLRSQGGHFRNPYKTFTVSDGIIEYSRGIWGQFVTKRFGPDAMLRTWEGVRSAVPLQAIDNTLRARYNSDFRQAFAEWCAWNAYTGPRADPVKWYPEGRNFPPMIESLYEVPTGGERQVSSTVGCLASRYFRFATGLDSLGLIVVYTANDCPTPTTSVSFGLVVSRTRPDETYRPTKGGFYFKPLVTNVSQWVVWESGSEGPTSTSAVAEGKAYPNPYLPGDKPRVYFPANASEGRLLVYTTNMELIHSEYQQTVTFFGKQAFWWDGRTESGEKARTGPYFFVLAIGDRTVTGKFVVVDK